MEITRQKNIASRVLVPMINSSSRPDYLATAVTSPVYTAQSWQDGQTAATLATTGVSITHKAGGLHEVVLPQAFLNPDSGSDDYVALKISGGNCDEQTILIKLTGYDAKVKIDSNLKSTDSNAITSSSIAANAIGASQIADNAIDAGAIASGAITSAKFATGAINAAAIADNAIDAGAIAANAITSAKIAANAIGATQIAADAITAAKIADNAITSDQIAAGAITSSEAPNLDVTVSSRLAASAAPANFGDLAITASTGKVTVGTNDDKTGYSVSTVNDKTGYSLSAAGILAIWHQLLTGITTVGSIGKKIKDWVLGSDNKSLISTDAQDLSGSLDVNTKTITAGAITATEAPNLDVAVSTRSDFNEANDPVEIRATGGTAGKNAEELVDDVWDELLTGASHNINTSAGRRLRQIQENGGYEGGAVWVDTINGTAGTTNYENGTADNPVDSIADARTIADSIGLNRFVIAPNSSITLDQAYNGFSFIGSNWTLNTNSKAIDNCYFAGASVSGEASAGANPVEFESCKINNFTFPNDTTFRNCAINSDLSIGEAGDYFFNGCYSGVAGTATPSIDFGSVGNTNLNFRHYSGGIEIKQMGVSGTDNMSLEGDGQLVINANCTGGTVAIRGNFPVTDNASGAVTLSDAARYAGADKYNGFIWLDGTASNSNTVPGVDGLEGNPVSTWAAVVGLAGKTGIRSIKLKSPPVLDRDLVSYELYGNEDQAAFSNVNGTPYSIDNSRFFRVMMDEDWKTGDSIEIRNVVMQSSDYNGFGNNHMKDSILCGTFKFQNSSRPVFSNCVIDADQNFIADYTNGGSIKCIMENCHGQITVDNMAAGQELYLSGAGVLDLGTPTGGTVYIQGNWEIQNAGSATINDEANVNKTNINGEVASRLDTAIPGSPTADSINERIKTLDDNYTAARAGNLDELDFDLQGKLGDIEGDTQDIQTQIGTAGAGLTDLGGMSTAMKAEVEAECTDALEAYDSGNGVARESSVLSIQNNTRFTASIPSTMLIPSSGSNVYKLNINFYDNDGNMEDPDGSTVDSGTTSGAATNKLIEAGQNFLTTVKVGDRIDNTTDSTRATVTAVDSDIQLTLDADIMTSGENYNVVRPDIGLDLDTADGTDKNAILFKEFAASNALDNSGISNHKMLERSGVGRFFCYVKIADTETEAQFLYNFALDENSERLYYNRSNNLLADAPGTTTLADNTTNKDIIAEALKERDVSSTSAVSGSIHKDIMDNIDANETKIDSVKTDTGNIEADTQDIQSKIGTPAADLAADIAAVKTDTGNIETDTQNIETQIGVAGAGLTDLGGMSTGMKAEVKAEADGAINDNRLNELMADNLGSQPAAGSLLGDLTEDDSGTQRFTANALEQAPTGGDATAANQTLILNNQADIKGTGFVKDTDSLVDLSHKAGAKGTDAIKDQADAIKAQTDISVYEGGIWFDEGAGNTNTVLGVDGTPNNPVSTDDAARTLGIALGIKRIFVAEQSSLVLGANFDGWEIIGIGSFDAENEGGAAAAWGSGSSVSGTKFRNVYIDSSNDFGSVDVENAMLNIANPNGIFRDCLIQEIVGAASGKKVTFENCYSFNLDSSVESLIDFDSPGSASYINLTNFKGKLRIRNMNANSNLFITGAGELIIEATCTAGNITLSGNWKVTDSGSATVTDDSNVNQTNINTQADQAIDDARLNEVMKDSLTAQPGAGSLMGDLTEDDGGSQRFTQNALEEAPVSDATAANQTTILNRLGTPSSDIYTEMAKDSTVAKDATVAKDLTVAKDSTVAKESTLATKASQASVDALPTASEIDTELSSNHGSGSWESASETDWTTGEKEQIRDALGVAGTKTAATGGQLQSVKTETDKIASIKAKTDDIQITDEGGGEKNVNVRVKKKDDIDLTATEKASVAAESKKAIFTDTLSEISDMTDLPAEPTLAQAAQLTYQERRNGVTTDDDLHQIFNDAGDVVIEQDLSDNNVTATADKLRDAA